MKEKSKKDIEPKLEYIVIICIVVIVSLFSLNSSPLIKNIKEIDSSVFIVMGKALLQNKTIYSDVFDHKGPIVYIINAIAILINSNVGLFIVETLLISIGSIFVFKASKIYLKGYMRYSITFFYILLSFKYLAGGNYTEEYSLTFSAIALYYIIRIIHLEELSNKKNWIVVGVMFAINLLIKQTYISIWIAFGITMLIVLIRDKKIKELLNGVKYAIIGIMIIFIPVLIYFIIKGNLNDFFNAYFTINMKYSGGSIRDKIYYGMLLQVLNLYFPYTIIGAFMCCFILKNKDLNIKEKSFSVLFFIITLLLTMTAINNYSHYLIQNSLATAWIFIFSCKKLKIKEFNIVILVGILVFLTINTIFAYKRNISIKLNYQATYIELDSIKEKWLNKDEEILVLGNDSFIYLYLDTYTSFKYFFQYPILNYDKNIGIETKQYILNNNPKIIFIRQKEMQYIIDEIKDYIDENYTKCIGKIGEYYIYNK